MGKQLSALLPSRNLEATYCFLSMCTFVWDMGSCVLSRHLEVLGRACQAVEICFYQAQSTLTTESQGVLLCLSICVPSAW